MDLARICFTPPPESPTRLRLFERPPVAFALLAVEWVGRTLVSAASAPFVLESHERAAAAAALPALSFGSTRELDVRAWTAQPRLGGLTTKYVRRDGLRLRKLVYFDAYPSAVWASMAGVYRRLADLHEDVAAGELAPPPPASVVLDSQLWFVVRVQSSPCGGRARSCHPARRWGCRHGRSDG